MPPTDHSSSWIQVQGEPAETLHQPSHGERAGGDGDAGQVHQLESDVHPGGLNGNRSVALCRTRFQRLLCRLCAGSSNRGASVLLAHDFQFESVVCYPFEGRAQQLASVPAACDWQRCCACAAALIDAKRRQTGKVCRRFFACHSKGYHASPFGIWSFLRNNRILPRRRLGSRTRSDFETIRINASASSSVCFF